MTKFYYTLIVIFSPFILFSQIAGVLVAPEPILDTFSITLLNASPGFTARDGAELLINSDGSIEQIMGWETGCVTDSTSWKSTDGGSNWTNNGDTGMPRGHTFGFTYKSPYYFRIGNDECIPVSQDDVWRKHEHPDSIWVKVADIPWVTPRVLIGTGVIEDSIYVYGGQTSAGQSSSTSYHDMWASGDAGFTWSLTCSDCIPQDAGNLAGTFANWNGSVWMVAGGKYTDSPIYTDNVYRFDQSLQQWIYMGDFPISAYYSKAFVHDNKLWALGGVIGSANQRILAYTRDGKNWTEIQDQPAMTALLYYHAATVSSISRTEILITSGNGTGGPSTGVSNDVFKIARTN